MIIGLIIIVLLFSVVAIVALYTSPTQQAQQVDPAIIQQLIEWSAADGTLQGNTFTVGEWNAEEDTDDAQASEVTLPSPTDAALGDTTTTVVLPDAESDGDSDDSVVIEE